MLGYLRYEPGNPKVREDRCRTIAPCVAIEADPEGDHVSGPCSREHMQTSRSFLRYARRHCMIRRLSVRTILRLTSNLRQARSFMSSNRATIPLATRCFTAKRSSWPSVSVMRCPGLLLASLEHDLGSYQITSSHSARFGDTITTWRCSIRQQANLPVLTHSGAT